MKYTQHVHQNTLKSLTGLCWTQIQSLMRFIEEFPSTETKIFHKVLVRSVLQRLKYHRLI